MIQINDINRIFGIKESWELPEKLMQILDDDIERQKVFDEFLVIEDDLSYDWFTTYFQEQHSNRESMMQDFTPKEVSGLLPELAGEYEKVLDVCAGTGGLTIAVWNKNKTAEFRCEELSTRAFPLLLFNLAIRDINSVAVNKDILTGEVKCIYRIQNKKIYQMDSVEENQKFDLVIMNPPYSVKYKFDEYDRRFMRYGCPPSQFADYAFILHGIDKMTDRGKVIAVLPHGILFRSGKEGAIRKNLICDDMLDTVIGLPEKLFMNTAIPTCICIFAKNTGQILIVDGAKEYTAGGKQNIFKPERILEVCRQRKEKLKLASLVTKEEIQENDYNLNIPRYVDTYEPEEIPDIIETLTELKKINDEINAANLEFLNMMKELTSEDRQEKRKLLQAVDIWESMINNEG